MKISILMPTYNDEKFIALAIKSVIDQTYSNWELLIMDDGSIDNTANIAKTFNDNRIHFFQQTNQGQLKALDNLSAYITGDAVLLLHSDDMLYKNTSLEENVKYFDNPKIDGIYCSLIQFYQSGKPDKKPPIPKKLRNGANKMLVLLGSNIIPDHFFIRTEKFLTNVRHNYLKWNNQYWLDFTKTHITNLNLIYTENSWYHYHVYDDNYTNSIIGSFEVYFGRMRTIYLISNYKYVPAHLVQKELMRRFGLGGFVISRPSTNKEISNYIKSLIRSLKKRTPGAHTWFFEQVQNFYASNNSRSIKLESKIQASYFGSDGRLFYKDLTNGTLPSVYKELISNLKIGFSSIIVSNDREKQEMEDILKFLCIRATAIVL